ncbi:MAG: N-6 DNA methylase [Polyangiaceae bacterium]
MQDEAIGALRALAARVDGDRDPAQAYRELVTRVLRVAFVGFAEAHELVERVEPASRALADGEPALDRLRGAARRGRDAELLGGVYEALIGLRLEREGNALVLRPGEGRRRSGSHYTPRELTAPVVEATLAPLLDGPDPAPVDERILALRVCDPAMGSGAFLLEVCRQLAGRLSAATGTPVASARRAVAATCLRGVDLDPTAVELARLSLWLVAAPDAAPSAYGEAELRCGDALVDASDERVPEPSARAFSLHAAFPDVFERGGFDAVVGNPPWVSYAGRAAQPLEPRLRAYYLRTFGAFAGYRNLQALFVERAVRAWLAPGGRLGFVLPSSMAELGGYRPSRAVHDRFAECDTDLPSLGEDAFPGVFQPSMVLRSTRRSHERADALGDPWPLARPDLDASARALLARLEGPTLPPALFGERGLQSSGEDVRHLLDAPTGDTVPIRAGADIQAFLRLAPSRHAEPAWFGARLRDAAQWSSVKLLIRQTARVPIAVRSDGAAFRNSLLAGFDDPAHPADFLVAWLNSTPIRWHHFHRHRDARLGMPQVKIGHLRAIPAPRDARAIPKLAKLGALWSRRNEGVRPDEQRHLDAVVGTALDLTRLDLERMSRDAALWSSKEK